jgi:hypothetical protein
LWLLISSPTLEALDSIKNLAEGALHETINNRRGFEVILNFLKFCMNFLNSIVE